MCGFFPLSSCFVNSAAFGLPGVFKSLGSGSFVRSLLCGTFFLSCVSISRYLDCFIDSTCNFQLDSCPQLNLIQLTSLLTSSNYQSSSQDNLNRLLLSFWWEHFYLNVARLRNICLFPPRYFRFTRRLFITSREDDIITYLISHWFAHLNLPLKKHVDWISRLTRKPRQE